MKNKKALGLDGNLTEAYKLVFRQRPDLLLIPLATLSLADLGGLSERPLPALCDMPEESRLVGYADGVSTLVAGRTVQQA